MANASIDLQHLMVTSAQVVTPSPIAWDWRLQASKAQIAKVAPEIKLELGDAPVAPAMPKMLTDSQHMTCFLWEVKTRLKLPADAVWTPNQLAFLQVAAGVLPESSDQRRQRARSRPSPRASVREAR